VNDVVHKKSLVQLFSWITTPQVMKTPPATYFIKKAAGITSGAQKPGHQSAGTISLKHLYSIAEVKLKDSAHVGMEGMVKSLIGTCKSMGVRVVAKPEDA